MPPLGLGSEKTCPAGLESPLTLYLLLFWTQQMSQFPIGGQPSSSLQDPPQLYSPASHPQFPLPPGVQQVPGGLEKPWTQRQTLLAWAGQGLL